MSDEKEKKVAKETPQQEAQLPIEPTSEIPTIENEIVENEEVNPLESSSETSKKEVENKDTEDTNDVALVEEEEEEEITSSDEEEEEEEEEIDYHSFSEKELIATFQKLLQEKPIPQIKNAVEEIKNEFNAKFEQELAHKKEEFLAEGGNIIDFHYSTPLKKEFNSLYFDYKEKRNSHYRNLKKDLQANLDKRLELIEELKGLLNVEDNFNNTYRHFKEIQEKWHLAGAIPRDKYNLVWNTYRHHVDNFYSFLHLNREFRELDFKHNLEQKLKIINRAEELTQEEDIHKAFRELQMLHKMWKDDVGPVAEELKDEVWDKFSAATKIIHDKRQAHFQELEAVFETNYETKSQLIDQIKSLTTQPTNSHKAWQNAMKKVQEIRDQYFAIGKVPREKNKETWASFKEATREFNIQKNNFYKNQKKEQFTNLEKKRELIKIAEENKTSDDFEVVTPLMKKIQNDWKAIGHVPRKESDKIWKQFKEACNFYFDRIHAEKNETNKEEEENLVKKQALLSEISSMELSDNAEEDLTAIKEKIKVWKTLGRVPFKKKSIDQKFNKELDGLFSKLNLSKQEAEMIRFENKLNAMATQEDERMLQNEEFFISKKISEVKSEILQLENNLGFFQHVDSNNPLVKDVHKNIKRQKDTLETWKEKMKAIRSLKKENE